MGRKGWSASRRVSQYCRNRSRQAFNNYWKKAHPPQERDPEKTAVIVAVIIGIIVISAIIEKVIL